MSYSMIDYEYDEPGFAGTVRAASCDTHRDILPAIDDYTGNASPHYLLMTRYLTEELEGCVMGFRALIRKQQHGRIVNILAALSIVGIPLMLYKAKAEIDGVTAKAAERRGFDACYLASSYKYKDGRVGVDLSKPSPAGDRLRGGRAPL